MASSEHSADTREVEKTDVESCSLSRFIKRYNIPQTVAATQALTYTTTSGNKVSLKAGDIILLRAVVTGSITLSYYDPHTAYTKDVHLPVNFPGRFEVLNCKYDRSSPGQSAGQNSLNTGSTDNPYENYVGKLYDRVEDLLHDCPPYFNSTESFVDPVNPDVNFRAGDRFRFVSIIEDTEGKQFLECKHMTGKLLRLPSYCRGQFQALQDKCFYTLSDLVAMAPVARRLRLAQDSLNSMYPVPGLKKGFTGDIHMHKPIKFVQVSPWQKLETTWNFPSDLNLQIQHYAAEEYETPVSHFDANRYTLAQFHLAFSDNFPVSACIQSYTDKPPVFAKFMPQRSPVVCVHKFDKVERILAKCDDQHFVLSPTLQKLCVALPKKFNCISQLLRTQPGTKVKLKETIACDIPAPLSLKAGDLLSISSKTSFTVVSVNYKWNNSTQQLNILKCDHISGKDVRRVKIPLDLELAMEEVLDNGREVPVPFEQFLQTKPEFPVEVEFQEPLHLTARKEMTLCATIRDPCLFVSNRPPDKTRCKDPSERSVMLEIPERHLVLLSFESLLQADEIEIREPLTVRQDVECVSAKLFTEMEKTDRAYETIAGRNLVLPKKIPYRRKTPRQKTSSLVSFSAISKSLPSLNALLSHKKQKELEKSESEMEIVHLDMPVHTGAADENLYEDMEIKPTQSMPVQTAKGQTTVKEEATELKRHTEKNKRLSRRSFFKRKSEHFS